jgi:hypothetical protein
MSIWIWSVQEWDPKAEKPSVSCCTSATQPHPNSIQRVFRSEFEARQHFAEWLGERANTSGIKDPADVKHLLAERALSGKEITYPCCGYGWRSLTVEFAEVYLDDPYAG